MQCNIGKKYLVVSLNHVGTWALCIIASVAKVVLFYRHVIVTAVTSANNSGIML